MAALGKRVVNDDNLKKAFQKFDTQNRGYISKADLKRGLSAFVGDASSLDDRTLHKIMKEVDRDGTGRISYEEFLATMLNLAEVPKPEKRNIFDGIKDLFNFDKK